jgi:hypothetical protein
VLDELLVENQAIVNALGDVLEKVAVEHTGVEESSGDLLVMSICRDHSLFSKQWRKIFAD